MTDTVPSAKPPTQLSTRSPSSAFAASPLPSGSRPAGVNVILGGDGKTTIFEVIALLFSPVNPSPLFHL